MGDACALVTQRMLLQAMGQPGFDCAWRDPHKFRLKDLLRQWAVPLALRPAYQLLEVQGQLIGLWSGSGLYQPNAAAQQTECSQAGLNLRYLMDGV